jgi:hypothetical protein
MTDMVKVFGCRPTQAVRLDSGRRTETAHVHGRIGDDGGQVEELPDAKVGELLEFLEPDPKPTPAPHLRRCCAAQILT